MDRTSSKPPAVVLSKITRPIAPPPANDNGRPWRCRACGFLLGIERGRELHVKYKDAEVWIVGNCRCVCRRCGEVNEVTVGASPRREEP
jgi:hypothetical protein